MVTTSRSILYLCTTLGTCIAEIWRLVLSMIPINFGLPHNPPGSQLLFSFSRVFFLLPKIGISTIPTNLLTEQGRRVSTPLPKGFGASTLCIFNCHIRMGEHFLEPRASTHKHRLLSAYLFVRGFAAVCHVFLFRIQQ